MFGAPQPSAVADVSRGVAICDVVGKDPTQTPSEDFRRI
jgi:hypothetical protein